MVGFPQQCRQPALEHPALLGVALQLQLWPLQAQLADGQVAPGQVQLGVAQQQPRQAGLRLVALAQRQAVDLQPAVLELECRTALARADRPAQPGLAIEAQPVPAQPHRLGGAGTIPFTCPFELDILQRQMAGQGQCGLCHGRLLRRLGISACLRLWRTRRQPQRQVELELASGRAQRQGRGPVGQIGREIQRGAVQPGFALARLGKGLQQRLGIYRVAIEQEAQARLALCLALRLQAAQEGQLQLELADLLRALERLVDEVDRALAQLQLEQREARQFRRRLLGLEQARDQVVDVVASAAQVAQPEMRPVELERVEHWRQPQQRTRIEVEIEPLERELLALALGIQQPQPAQLELERPGLELDPLDADLAPERGTGLALELPLEQWRQAGPGQQPEQQQPGQRQPGGAQPAPGHRALRWRLRFEPGSARGSGLVG